ncbi:hypothetical protein [Apilactobacillus ozensis]|uniref:hypothetical protein n=1 Tax=Apilactobacillus ozensis TaxID=866801 RepID=UPI0006D2BE1E|nr:hypothetical protein [Apilactobacillus ozensis]
MASVTTLALMGMTAFSLNVSNVTVKADDVSATQSKQNSDNTSEDQGASAATNSMAAQSGADSTYIDAYNGATAAKSAYDNYAKSNGTSSYYPEYNSQGDSTTSSKDTNVENGGQNEESGQPENNKPVDNTTETSQTKNADYATQTSAAQASATSYERSLTSSANSNNASVSLAEGKVSVPTSDSTKDGSTNAYKYGANYFLASQGATDARTGKWNGYYYDKDGNKQLSSYAPDSTSSNAYDQGYLGAQYAIRQQFNQDDSINSSLSAADVSKK